MAAAQNDPYDLLEKHYSADRVLAHAAVIYENDRWNRFSGYKKTADYLEKKIKSYGADDFERISIPCDGRTKLGDWILPLAWEAEDGLLELLDSTNIAVNVLADYKAVPNGLTRWSPPTKPEGEIRELVYIADARDEKAWKDTRGKMVFTHSGPGGFVYGLAVRNGASGIVTDYSTAPVEYAKETHWWNTWTSLWGWGLTKQDKPLIGFVLSPEKGRELEKVIRGSKTPLKVRVKIDARTYEGTTDVVTATIRGSTHPQDEVVFYSHLYECQIDDNAVCAGMQLEMIRIMKKLIAEERLARPQRTIRFMMGWEWIGSQYYALHCKGRKNWVASLCYDGAATKQKYTRLPLCLHVSPGFQASFADVLFVQLWKKHFAKHLPMVAWHTAPWMCGTDTIWVDPTLGNVSNVFPYQSVGRTWHKSHSTLEMIDPDVVQHSALTSLTWALLIACASHDDLEYFQKISADHVEREIRKYGSSFDFNKDSIAGLRKRLDFDMNYLRQKAENMRQSVARLGRKNRGDERLPKRVKNALFEEQRRLNRMLAKKAAGRDKTMRQLGHAQDRDELAADNMVPVRLVSGGLWSQCKFSARERKKFVEFGFSQLWLFLCDGRRSVWDIARTAEHDNAQAVNLRHMINAFEMLAKAGYVRLKYKKNQA